MADRLASLDASRFDPYVGSTFALRSADQSHPAEQSHPLVLVEVQRGALQPGAPREAPFTLCFTASTGAGLPQATYELVHADLGELAVFLVPRQPGADGLPRLEALFN